MRLPPDLAQFTLAHNERKLMAPDTWGFYSWVATNGASFLSRIPPAPPVEDGREKWRRFQREALACEANYLSWRETATDMRLITAQDGHEMLPEHFSTMIESMAVILLTRGFETYDRRAEQFLDERYSYSFMKGVTKRSARRCHHDLDGYNPDKIKAAVDFSNVIYNEVSGVIDEIEDLREYLPRDFTIDSSNMRTKLDRARRRRRRAVIRAIGFASRLLGSDQTRLFIRGDRLRLQGELAVYDFESNKKQSRAHGGATLRLFTPDGETELCKLCIYTPNVPLMDHIASMVMHIQAGEEAEILKIGNAFDIQDAALTQEWLLPYLPEHYRSPAAKKQVEDAWAGRRFILGNHSARLFLSHVPRFPNYRAIPLQTPVPEDQHERLLNLSRGLLAQAEDELGEYMPPKGMRFYRHLLTTGHMPLQEDVEDREPMREAA